MEIIITPNQANQRFDRFLRKYCKQYPDVSLTEIYKGIRKWFIKINGRKAKENQSIQEGDVVTIKDQFSLWKHDPEAKKSIKDKQKEHIDRQEIKARIIDETDDRLVRNKPAGIVMHESAQHYKDLSMHDYLDEYLKKCNTSSSWTEWRIQDNQKDENEKKLGARSQQQEAKTFKPSFGYRLDKDTSGVLIAAKSYAALQYINKIIRERKVDKRYMTIVSGVFPKTFTSDKSLEKSYSQKWNKNIVKVSKSGKESLTQARCHNTRTHPILGTLSLVKVKITTGRMHQIRVHLANAWYPIAGDISYGNPVINRKLYKECKIKRQLLHCQKYSFYDDINKKNQSRQAPLPDDFTQIWSPIL